MWVEEQDRSPYPDADTSIHAKRVQCSPKWPFFLHNDSSADTIDLVQCLQRNKGIYVCKWSWAEHATLSQESPYWQSTAPTASQAGNSRFALTAYFNISSCRTCKLTTQTVRRPSSSLWGKCYECRGDWEPSRRVGGGSGRVFCWPGAGQV